MRRWLRIPPPPVPRQPCDCAALAEQNVELRQRLELLAAVYQAADEYTDGVGTYEALVTAVLAVRGGERG